MRTIKTLIFFLILGNVFCGLIEIVGNLFRQEIFDFVWFLLKTICFRRYAELYSTINKSLKFLEDEKISVRNSKKRKLFHDIFDTIFPDHKEYATKFEFIAQK